MMHRRTFYVELGTLFLLTALNGCRPPEPLEIPPGDYQRIVTLSPSLSETLYALGLGERVVGVTFYARWPEEVIAKPKVGGYTDINIEAVYALQPDLVLALEQQDSTIRQLRALGLPVVAFKNETPDEILHLIRCVGTLLNRNEKAEALCREIDAARETLRAEAATRPRPRVLVSVGRNMGSGRIGDVHAAGPATLFGEIIQLAGGENVYQGEAPYAALSKEAILRLNPEVILDLIPDIDTLKEYTQTEALRQWQEFGHVDAVVNGRVSIHVADYICMPGPRVAQTMQDLARAIHAEPGKKRLAE